MCYVPPLTRSIFLHSDRRACSRLQNPWNEMHFSVSVLRKSHALELWNCERKSFELSWLIPLDGAACARACMYVDDSIFNYRWRWLRRHFITLIIIAYARVTFVLGLIIINECLPDADNPSAPIRIPSCTHNLDDCIQNSNAVSFVFTSHDTDATICAKRRERAAVAKIDWKLLLEFLD